MWGNRGLRTRVSRVRLVTLFSTLALLGSLVFVSAAGGITLYHFRGTVADPLGRPLPASTVTDGFETVTTDADGKYALPESSTGTFTLRASRPHSASASKQVTVVVPIDTVVDFTLKYVIDGSLSSPYLSTASGPLTSAVSITSWAPAAGSCVKVLDSRTNATLPASLQSVNPDGSSTWSAMLSLDQNTPDGTYQLSVWAEDCASGAGLTITDGVPYIVDNVPPLIVPQSVMPHDGGSTVFGTAQPLLARVGDTSGGAGVNDATVSFELSDETVGTALTLSATRNAATWWAKTAPVSLQQGHVFKIKVTASDFAGNESEFEQLPGVVGGGFVSTTFGAQDLASRIPPVECVLGEVGIDGQRDATCEDVILEADSTSVVLGEARRGPARGYVDYVVPLASARFRTDIAGVPLTQPAFPPGTTEEVTLHFDVQAPSSGALSLVAEGTTRNLGTVRGRVPATWTSATLEMTETPASGATQACADPSVAMGSEGSITCTPDPLASEYLVVPRTDVTEAAAAQVAQAAGMSLTDSHPGGVRGYASLPEARSLAGLPEVGVMVPAGGFTTVVGWGEWHGSICETRSLVIASERVGEGVRAGHRIRSGFDLSVSRCELTTPTAIDVRELIDDVPPPPSACPGSRKYSASHTIQEPLSTDLAWLRAKHGVAWNSGCEVRWVEPMKLRTGHGPCWWQPGTPSSTRADWGQGSVVRSSFEATFKSREHPEWNQNCHIGDSLPADWAGANCDVRIWGDVQSTVAETTWATQKTITPVGQGQNGACSWLHSATDDDHSTDLWHGKSDDICRHIVVGGTEASDCS